MLELRWQQRECGSVRVLVCEREEEQGRVIDDFYSHFHTLGLPRGVCVFVSDCVFAWY